MDRIGKSIGASTRDLAGSYRVPEYVRTFLCGEGGGLSSYDAGLTARSTKDSTEVGCIVCIVNRSVLPASAIFRPLSIASINLALETLPRLMIGLILPNKLLAISLQLIRNFGSWSETPPHLVGIILFRSGVMYFSLMAKHVSAKIHRPRRGGGRERFARRSAIRTRGTSAQHREVSWPVCTVDAPNAASPSLLSSHYVCIRVTPRSRRCGTRVCHLGQHVTERTNPYELTTYEVSQAHTSNAHRDAIHFSVCRYTRPICWA